MRTLVAQQRVFVFTGTPDPTAPGRVEIREDPASPTVGAFKVDRIYIGYRRDEVGHLLQRIEEGLAPSAEMYVMTDPTNNGKCNVWKFTGEAKKA